MRCEKAPFMGNNTGKDGKEIYEEKQEALSRFTGGGADARKLWEQQYGRRCEQFANKQLAGKQSAVGRV